MPLVWVGFSPEAVGACLFVNLVYQFYTHNTWMPKLGWLEYVLDTPSHHRVHHAANLCYLDANYGGVFIIWDRLFGTLVTERDDEPCRYGLVRPLRSYNPLVITFFEWAAMLCDLARAQRWRDCLGYVFAPPGWRPRGEGMRTEDLRRLARAAAE